MVLHWSNLTLINIRKRRTVYRIIVNTINFVKNLIHMHISCISFFILAFANHLQSVINMHPEKTEQKEEIPSESVDKLELYMQDDKEYMSDCCCPKHTDEHISFSLDGSALVVTDIIESTRLYNENPIRMKNSLESHYQIVNILTRKYRGHIVGNDGDSFSVVFENFDCSLQFCKELQQMQKENITYFSIRIGICQGRFYTRKLQGYELFGNSIEQLKKQINHNKGQKICVNNVKLDKNSKEFCSLLCVH